MEENPDSYILLKGIKLQYLTKELVDDFISIVDKLDDTQIR
jgi:hypothetical protein